ncbi:hypothetical protein F2P56_026018 [Juglans regia]|uniref:Axoneme-associated protein mst101(2)-like n=2 Tax=Juglans regia TaxID=51240 RepID=A0A833WMG7_JUGRE|nr:axoneme-associated protein mst101(2)-like [Juglans regia]KAF5456548.1 hypothetical protein F2P56_026018 [Juglans regia]
MTTSKLLLLSIFLSLVLAHVRASVPVDEDEAVKVAGSDGSDYSSALKIELKQLKFKIQELESHVDKKSKELKAKSDSIGEKEKIIQEKSDTIASLQSEIASLQKKGTLDAAELVRKAHARIDELEKQADKRKSKLETQNKEKKALEARVDEAERKVHDLSLELETLQKINDEQKTRIHKIERALKVAEEEMIKAKSEATSKTKKLKEVHGAWFPPWLAVHLIHCQSFMETHWNERGKPVMDMVIEKALEKKAQAEKWAAPHMEIIKTKWISTIKEQWVVLKTNTEPRVQTLRKKTIEVYEASKTKVTPHLVQVQKFIDPYFQDAKKFSKPYIDQIADVAKPHVEKVRVAIKPYTKEVVYAYGEFLKSATTYHHQMQATVQEMLKRHELTRPLATKELEWFAASALLAVPIIILFRIASTIFYKKVKKPTRNAHTNHARRKAKRVHPDK